MLVLSRKVGEEIVIDKCIQIKVTKIRGGQVWLGIAAPLDIPVHRREIQLRIDQPAELELDDCPTQESCVLAFAERETPS
jgi:carbon storage regulator